MQKKETDQSEMEMDICSDNKQSTIPSEIIDKQEN